MLQTELTRRWGLRTPIVQAPMAGVSGGRLAGAVSGAGGLGMIGVAPTTTPAWIAEQAALARPHGAFGIGLLLWAVRERPEQFEAVLAERPAVVALSFGDPTIYIQRAQAAGIRAAVQVQTSTAARQAIQAGADAVVLQGTEAGGHTGDVGTVSLLQSVLDERMADRPLILAAGGIASGRAVAGMLAMGADGVWIGTRFVASEEALGDEAAKQAVIAAAETDTTLTHVFDIVQGFAWPEEFPGRALRNEFADQWHGNEAGLIAELDTVRPQYNTARVAGDLRQSHVYAGQAVGVIRDILPAAELVRRLDEGAEHYLRQAAELFR